MISRRRTLLVLVSFLAACSAETATDPAHDEHAGRAAAPVIGGEASTVAQNAVVMLVRLVPDGYITCTGTLIAPNLVLTARHCVSETSDADIVCRVDGTSITGGEVTADTVASEQLIYTGVDGRMRFNAGGTEDAKGKLIVHDSSMTLCDSDLGFIVLDRALPGRFAPIRVASGALPAEKLTLVGWGLENSGALPTMRMQRPDVVVTDVGPKVLDKASMEGLGASEFEAGESICSGDSGGPMFSAAGALVGVVSRGGGGNITQTNDATSCIGANVSNVFTHLAQKPDLVAKAFAAAGATPRTENDKAKMPVGAACTQSFDCVSDACVGGKCVAHCGDPGCKTTDLCTSFEDTKVCTPDPHPTPVVVSTPPPTPAGALPVNNSSGGCGVATTGGRGDGGMVLVGLALMTAAWRARRSSRGEEKRRSAKTDFG